MMKTTFTCITAAAILTALGCGENIQDPVFAVTFGPPQNVKALSVDTSSIALSWTPGIGAEDTTFLGYIINLGGIEDSIPKTHLAYRATALVPGIASFTLHSYQSDGPRSNGVTISWAPAARFDIPVVVTEYYLQLPTRLSGVNIGSETTDPFSYPLEPVDPTVLNSLDLYLYGGAGQVDDSLALWSMDLFRADLRKTRFSTTSDSSSTALDFPRASFPADETFTRDRVTVRENRIYYLRITGDERSDTLYARVHVRIVPDTFFPSRQVEIRVSLQRVPGIPFAEGRTIRAEEKTVCPSSAAWGLSVFGLII